MKVKKISTNKLYSMERITNNQRFRLEKNILILKASNRTNNNKIKSKMINSYKDKNNRKKHYCKQKENYKLKGGLP